MEKNKRGRKPLPEAEKKIRIYILVKRKHAARAQRELNKVAAKYGRL